MDCDNERPSINGWYQNKYHQLMSQYAAVEYPCTNSEVDLWLAETESAKFNHWELKISLIYWIFNLIKQTNRSGVVSWESYIECKIELTRYQPVLLGVYIHQNLAQLQVNPNHIK